ncbi:uncharacterized protein LOC131320378 isoform X2 [Rhododendron vialii]|uniref:uncharacterized protein LOC131320378 isoform X2 n=1 Tax=Rhododendron vialii TaxID=182163 RepID=UPI00265EBD28|nr:uncharacterized protein LOC131320378 isoform X2 [Rhododendron vialii]XP_058207060.1 uncharacterized protein LOC131320378 isoform X2 [Rhododendron vialii]
METTIAPLHLELFISKWCSGYRSVLLVVYCHFLFALCLFEDMEVSPIYLLLFHRLPFVLPGFLNMADFPPNLEDGEQWLPADIYHEIVYGSFEPKALADNTSEEGATEVETFDHGGNGVLTEQCCLWPVPRYGEEQKGFAGNSGGTGVFLPQTLLMESTENKGTGVFLQTFTSNGPVTVRKSKKSGKNGKMFFTKKGAPSGKKEVSQVPAEICLPAEWTY